VSRWETRWKPGGLRWTSPYAHQPHKDGYIEIDPPLRAGSLTVDGYAWLITAINKGVTSPRAHVSLYGRLCGRLYVVLPHSLHRTFEWPAKRFLLQKLGLTALETKADGCASQRLSAGCRTAAAQSLCDITAVAESDNVLVRWAQLSAACTALVSKVKTYGRFPSRFYWEPPPTFSEIEIDTKMHLHIALGCKATDVMIWISRYRGPACAGFPRLTARMHTKTGCEGQTLGNLYW